MKRFFALIRPASIIVIILASAASLMAYAALTDAPIVDEPASAFFTSNFFLLRGVSIFLALLLILVLYFWTSEFLGKWWAFLPTFLFAFSPRVLNFGHYLTSEIAITFLTLITIILFFKLLSRFSIVGVVFFGLTAGVLFLLDPPATILVIYFLLAAFIYALVAKKTRSLKTIFGFLPGIAISQLVVWGLAGILSLKYGAYYVSQVQFSLENAFYGAHASASALQFLSQDISFWIIAVLFAAALFAGAGRFFRNIRHRDIQLGQFLDLYIAEFLSAVFIIFVFLLYPVFTFVVLPLFFFLAGSFIKQWLAFRNSKENNGLIAKINAFKKEIIRLSVKAFLLIIVLAAYVGFAIAAAPNFLREDRGQDLLRLTRWMQKENIQKIAVDYYGTVFPTAYLGSAAELWWSAKNTPLNEGIGWFAISKSKLAASILVSRPEDTYSWLRDKDNPYIKIGNTIFVYQIATPEN